MKQTDLPPGNASEQTANQCQAKRNHEAGQRVAVLAELTENVPAESIVALQRNGLSRRLGMRESRDLRNRAFVERTLGFECQAMTTRGEPFADFLFFPFAFRAVFSWRPRTAGTGAIHSTHQTRTCARQEKCQNQQQQK